MNAQIHPYFEAPKRPIAAWCGTAAVIGITLHCCISRALGRISTAALALRMGTLTLITGKLLYDRASDIMFRAQAWKEFSRGENISSEEAYEAAARFVTDAYAGFNGPRYRLWQIRAAYIQVVSIFGPQARNALGTRPFELSFEQIIRQDAVANYIRNGRLLPGQSPDNLDQLVVNESEQRFNYNVLRNGRQGQLEIVL